MSLKIQLIALAALFAAATPLRASSPPPSGLVASAVTPNAPAGDTLALSQDATERLTIPVEINGQGPFPFLIDTGADRTVLSRELAERLGLEKGARIAVANSGGVDVVDSAVVRRLKIGARVIDRIEAPLLKAADIGAMGMLGIDSLKGQEVILDFRAKELRTAPSQTVADGLGVVVVHGKSRFGQLVLVDAQVRDVRVFVILDSGAQSSIGNPALQRLLRASADGAAAKIISVTGRETPAKLRDVAEAKIGALTVHNMPIAFADLDTFRRFGLSDQPALLLGMDVMQHCEEVVVDFERREARFKIN